MLKTLDWQSSNYQETGESDDGDSAWYSTGFGSDQYFGKIINRK
ncbi:hypothetical protein [Levilactobacillus sp. N40-8-2]